MTHGHEIPYDSRGWITEEAAWLFAQFAKVALSVFVARAVTKLFQTGVASQQAYVRASRLWTNGDQGRVSPEDQGGAWRSTANGSGGQRDNTYSAPPNSGNGADHGARFATPENPRYVTTVGGYHLYWHRKVLNPGRQLWPCPLLYVSPCETCSLLEYDGGGRPQCVPLVKLGMVLDGNDGGEDLNEIRQWIRSS